MLSIAVLAVTLRVDIVGRSANTITFFVTVEHATAFHIAKIAIPHDVQRCWRVRSAPSSFAAPTRTATDYASALAG